MMVVEVVFNFDPFLLVIHWIRVHMADVIIN
jgi:hypothetical protein